MNPVNRTISLVLIPLLLLATGCSSSGQMLGGELGRLHNNPVSVPLEEVSVILLKGEWVVATLTSGEVVEGRLIERPTQESFRLNTGGTDVRLVAIANLSTLSHYPINQTAAHAATTTSRLLTGALVVGGVMVLALLATLGNVADE